MRKLLNNDYVIGGLCGLSVAVVRVIFGTTASWYYAILLGVIGIAQFIYKKSSRSSTGH